MKPNIKRLAGIWYCAGSGVMTIAFKPWDAYVDWLRTCAHVSIERINEIWGHGF